MDIYITRDGQQFGPYSLEQAHDYVQTGELKEADLAWAEGLPGWMPLKEIPGYVVPRKAPDLASMLPPIPAPAPARAPLATMEAPATAGSPIITPQFGNSQLSTSGEPIQHPDAQDKGLLQKLGGGLVAAGIAAFKFKAFFFPILKTGLSMFIMIWFYSTIFGWRFAAGFVFLILVHEMGHVVAAWAVGLPVTAPIFIPFVGALITLKENPRDAWTEALVGYGGPLAGCIGSWICFVVGFGIGSNLWIAVASLSFLINLFNLIPFPPLDGGRICAAISPWFWALGVALMIFAMLYFISPVRVIIFVIVFGIAGWSRIQQTFFGTQTPEMVAYYNTGLPYRLIMAGMFVALLVALIIGYGLADLALKQYWQDDN